MSSWRPGPGTITYGQMAVIATVIGTCVTATVHIRNTIDDGDRRVEKMVHARFASEREEARREFAPRSDVLVLRSKLEEALTLLREVRQELREERRRRYRRHRQ